MKTKNPAAPTQYQVTLNFSVLRPDLSRKKLERMIDEFANKLADATESQSCNHEIKQLAPDRFAAKLCAFIADLEPSDWDPVAIDFLKDFTEGWDENDEELKESLFDAMSQRIVDIEFDNYDTCEDLWSDLKMLRELLQEHLGEGS